MSFSATEPQDRPAPPSVWPAWGALLVVALLFVLRVPAAVQPMGPDQGVYATIGWGLGHGLALYRDLWEQKPPGIYLAYRLGFAAFGTRETTIFVLEFLASAVATAGLFVLGARMVSARFGALLAVVFAIATFPAARHGLGGFLERSVTETFIIPLAVLAACAMQHGFSREKHGWWFAAGLLIGLAGIFKQTALIYWPAFTVWIWWMAGLGRATRFALTAGGGVLIAPALAVIWLWQKGVLEHAWVAVVAYPVAYLAAGDEGILSILDRFAHEVWRRMKTDEVWAFGSLGAAVALARWRTWRTTPSGSLAALALVWLAAAQIAIIANGPRMFMTYFLPSLVPLALLIAWLLREVGEWRHRRKRVVVVLLLALAAVMLVRSNSIRRGARMLAWDVRHLLGQTPRDDYLQMFRSRDGRAFSAPDNERVAAYVREHSGPGDRIFVFGMAAAIYFSSERLPGSRFLFVYPAVSNMIDRPEFKVETLAAELGENAPRYVILQRGNGDSFSGWRAVDSFASPAMEALLRSYHKETEIGGFDLYRRSDP